jgi:hypothetical protein
LNTETITAAIDGFEAQKARIDLKIADSVPCSVAAPPETAATPASTKPGQRKMSAAARKRMAAAQGQTAGGLTENGKDQAKTLGGWPESDCGGAEETLGGEKGRRQEGNEVAVLRRAARLLKSSAWEHIDGHHATVQ